MPRVIVTAIATCEVTEEWEVEVTDEQARELLGEPEHLWDLLAEAPDRFTLVETRNVRTDNERDRMAESARLGWGATLPEIKED